MATPSGSTTPLIATCHCGAMTIQVPGKPREINDCQCTVCRRWGAAWGYYNPELVKISVKSGSPSNKYVWGDRKIEFHHCSTCSCVMYWISIGENDEMGINTRMMDPDDIRTVNRKTDYEMLSTPLDVQETAHSQDKAKY